MTNNDTDSVISSVDYMSLVQQKSLQHINACHDVVIDIHQESSREHNPSYPSFMAHVCGNDARSLRTKSERFIQFQILSMYADALQVASVSTIKEKYDSHLMPVRIKNDKNKTLLSSKRRWRYQQRAECALDIHNDFPDWMNTSISSLNKSRSGSVCNDSMSSLWTRTTAEMTSSIFTIPDDSESLSFSNSNNIFMTDNNEFKNELEIELDLQSSRHSSAPAPAQQHCGSNLPAFSMHSVATVKRSGSTTTSLTARGNCDNIHLWCTTDDYISHLLRPLRNQDAYIPLVYWD